jgi:hypothetical protein
MRARYFIREARTVKPAHPAMLFIIRSEICECMVNSHWNSPFPVRYI